MDTQKALNVLLGVLIAVIGWFANTTYTTVQTQQTQLTQLNIELAKNYVPRAELQSTFDKLFAELSEIRKSVTVKK